MDKNPSWEVEFELRVPPYKTPTEVKDEFYSIINELLEKGGQENLLRSGELKIKPEKTFLTEITVMKIVLAATGVAANTLLRRVIVPLIQDYFGIDPTTLKVIKSKDYSKKKPSPKRSKDVFNAIKNQNKLPTNKKAGKNKPASKK